METISVVLATYNEEENLYECLRSVKGFADEIIVVDGSSTDKTVKIAESFGAKVIVTNNPSIFHINKQKAISLATKNWILQLDADERITDELKEEIKAVTKNPAINGFWIPRRNLFLGRFLMKGGQFPDYTLRLYRRGKGRLPQKTVHEQAVVEGSVKYLKNPLIHLADTSLSRYFLRFNRYTNLLADEIRKERKNKVVLFIKYFLLLPSYWFLKTYIRHKGFMDSWQGFIFSLFSSFRYPIALLKVYGIL